MKTHYARLTLISYPSVMSILWKWNKQYYSTAYERAMGNTLPKGVIKPEE